MPYFWTLVRTSARQQMTYRMAMWAGLATNLFFGLLRAAVLLALYNGQPVVNGLTMEGALTYVAFSQALIAFLTVFGSFDIMRTVYDGSISGDLLRPANFYFYWMGREAGRAVVNLFWRGLVFIGLFALFYPIQTPASFTQWLLLTLSLLLSWLLNFTWIFLTNLLAFWTPDAQGILRWLFGLAQLLSGWMVPLRLMPDWFSRICAFTPFPGMFNTSLEVYLGLLPGPAVWQALGLQLAWLILFVILAQVIYRAGIRRLVIQGG